MLFLLHQQALFIGQLLRCRHRGRVAVGLVLAVTAGMALTQPAGAYEALPSWRPGKTKQAITNYVSRITTKGSADYVPPAERIAVFDNDGTLWPENPLPFQLAYVLDRLKQRLRKEPALLAEAAVQAAEKGDLPKLVAGKGEGLVRVFTLSQAGLTDEEFRASVEQWLATARHPRYGKPYTELAYQPMLELLNYLRANSFKTFIVSGGGSDFMRVWSERVYGIPPEQVVGSTAVPRFEWRRGQPVLVKTMDRVVVNDKAAKPVSIQQAIGRRPIAAFGNSDGDLQMLQYTTIGNPRPAFGLIVHHTDGEREYAYDARPRSSGKLVEALRDAPLQGWVVVDMKRDWSVLFPYQAAAEADRLRPSVHPDRIPRVGDHQQAQP